MSTHKEITLRSGKVLDLSLRGTPCVVTHYGGEQYTRAIVGTFHTRKGVKYHVVSTEEALSGWDGSPTTVPGVMVLADDVYLPEPPK